MASLACSTVLPFVATAALALPSVGAAVSAGSVSVAPPRGGTLGSNGRLEAVERIAGLILDLHPARGRSVLCILGAALLSLGTREKHAAKSPIQ